MAQISSYPYDVVVQDNDAWIGTDSVNRKTKQYTAEALANYLNVNGKISVGGQMVYSFSSAPLSGDGTFSLPNGGGSSAYSSVTSIKISILEKSGQNVVAFVSYLVGSEILISAQDEISSFGHYGVTSYNVDPSDNDYYVLNLSYIGGNGSLAAGKLYDIIDFLKPSSAEVEAVSGGLGIEITGTTEQPVVNMNYSGSNNFIEIAPAITSVDSSIYSPEILVSKSNPSEPVDKVSKIKISNITLNKLGSPTTNLSLNNNRLIDLSLPVDLNDAANKQYVLNELGSYIRTVQTGPGLKAYGSPSLPTIQVEFLGMNNYIKKASTITSIDSNEIPFISVERSNVNTTFGTGVVSKIKLNEVTIDKLGAPVASLSMGSQKITDLGTPTLGSDATNKTYVDASIASAGTVTSISNGTGINASPNPITATGSISLNYNSYVNSTPYGSTTAESLDEIPISRPGYPYKVYKTSLSSLPIDALTTVKNYVDNAVIGSLVYQGAYNPVTNTPDLDRDVVVMTVGITSMGNGGGSLGPTVVDTFATTGTGQGLTLNIQLNSSGNVISATVANGGTGYAVGDTVGLTGLSGHSGSVISIATIATAGSFAPDVGTKKGWTYTVIADGDFYGEQVRVGDLLIAESNNPGDLANWTTVQNNIDLASATQVGVGNVVAGEAATVAYSNGTATVGVEDSTASNKGAVIVAGGTDISVVYANGTATINNTATSPASSASGTISAGQTSGTVTHTLGANVMVQTFKSTGETVFCEIDRTATTVTATINPSISSDISILVHKIA